MTRTPKDTAAAWFGYLLLIVFFTVLTAFILYATMDVFFPQLMYQDYLLPAFGILFAISAGNDISNLKTDFAIKRKRREHYKN